MSITLIAAVGDNGVIGANGGIPWDIPEDWAHFKDTTMGGVLIMGRATYESIGFPLPGRRIIVLTRDPDWTANGVVVLHDLKSALEAAERVGGEVFIGGGESVYREALAVADAQILTEVHISPEGDTRYPEFDKSEWVEERREQRLDAEIPHEYVWWKRG